MLAEVLFKNTSHVHMRRSDGVTHRFVQWHVWRLFPCRVQPDITDTVDWGVKYQFPFLCSAGTCVPMQSWCLRRLTCRGCGSGFPVSFTHSDMALWSLSQCSQSLCSPSTVLLQSHTVPLQSFTVPLQSHTVPLQPLPSAWWTSGLWVLMFHW